MTSSLVGSEMCIRDRSCVVPVGDYPCPRAPCNLWYQCPGSCGITSSPISYTHLTLPTICSV
eukprot:1139517-Prorocentrum_lima.AAC.1